MPGIWLAWMTENIIGWMRHGMTSHTSSSSTIISLWGIIILQTMLRILQKEQVRISYMFYQVRQTQTMCITQMEEVKKLSQREILIVIQI